MNGRNDRTCFINYGKSKFGLGANLVFLRGAIFLYIQILNKGLGIRLKTVKRKF